MSRRSVPAVALLLAACTAGPVFRRPAPPVPPDWQAETPADGMPRASPGAIAVQRLRVGVIPERQWWHAFGSPALDAQVAQALGANPDIAAARAALHAAQELALAQQAAMAPSAQASWQSSRQRTAVGTLAPALQSGQAVYSLHTAQVSVGYVPDVFGGLGRQAEQAAAQEEVQRWQAQAAGLSIAAGVVLSAVNEAGLRAQLASTGDLLRLERGQRDLLDRQRDLGAATDADVLAQETALAQLEASLPGLRRQLATQRHLRLTLTGQAAQSDAGPDFMPGELALPLELPLLLPAQLVDRRPDVRAAEAQLHVATAGLGVAISNRLPQFSLSAGYGGSATRPGDLLAPANTFWTLAGGLAATVFDAGALRHRAQAADAQRAQAAALYRTTVLTAFQNVADVLAALREDAEAGRASGQAVQLAERSLQLARQGQLLGVTGNLPVLQAEQALVQARLAEDQAATSRLADTVALYQSLGGGWGEGDEPATAPAP